jgi:HEXXH motif-containing protein
MKIDLSDHGQLWFPGLAERLVSKDGATALGLGDRQRSEPDQPAQERSASWQLGRTLTSIEYPQSAIARRFSELSFAAVDPESARAQLQQAADVLGTVDGLVDTLGLLVRTVYLLQAPIGYDVSHSDPELPFSVFLSLPQPGETDARLRVAEALLHEAMHLQLTMIEHWIPLISNDVQCGYSPWKHELRPVGGLLHGLYVFAVIHQLFDLLVRVRGEFRGYSDARRSAIEYEVGVLPENMKGLSPIGSDVWHKCWNSVLCSSQ